MRQFVTAILILALIATAIVSVLFIAAGVGVGFTPTAIIGMSAGAMNLAVIMAILGGVILPSFNPFGSFWRWLRQQDKIEEMDQRIVDLINDGASLYEKAAEISAEMENETRNYEYNMKRVEKELQLLKDKYEIAYRTWIYNVTHPKNAGLAIMQEKAERNSEKAKAQIDENIAINLTAENQRHIKAISLEQFLTTINP